LEKEISVFGGWLPIYLDGSPKCERRVFTMVFSWCSKPPQVGLLRVFHAESWDVPYSCLGVCVCVMDWVMCIPLVVIGFFGYGLLTFPCSLLFLLLLNEMTQSSPMSFERKISRGEHIC